MHRRDRAKTARFSTRSSCTSPQPENRVMPHEGTRNITSNDRRSRRQFLTGVAAASAGLALGCVDRADMLAPLVRPRSNAQLVGASADGGFDHVIVLMMENRSF